MQCALVDFLGKVVNIIMADPTVDQPPMFHSIVEIPENASVNIGDTWTGSTFLKPPKPKNIVDGLEML